MCSSWISNRAEKSNSDPDFPISSDSCKRPKQKPPTLPSIQECRTVLAGVQIDARGQIVERRAAYINALRERWPELTALAALFVVQSLDHDA